MIRLLSLPQPEVPDLPPRVPPDLHDPVLVDLVMREYGAIRNELDASLSAQVSIMSFGSATAGLLVAAAGTLWAEEPLLAGLLLLLVVPSACFLALAIHAGEMVRLMRAGLFLNAIENWVNRAPWPTKPQDRLAGVLTWEQWGIRDGAPDMAGHNRRAILLTFGLLAFGFMLAGFWRLHDTDGLHEALAIGSLVVGLTLGVQALRWILRLHTYAYKHRRSYEQTASTMTPTPGGHAPPTSVSP